MDLDKDKKQYRAEQDAKRPRNDEGEYVTEYLPPSHHKDPVGEVFADNVHYSRKQDDLLDIRVGNPLQRIVDLLEQIKKQKAFSFTIKGSLGIAGVFLTLSVFGIFGGGKILCDKGIQTQIGRVQALKIYQIEKEDKTPVLSDIVSFFQVKTSHQRIVLIKGDNSVVDLPYHPNVDMMEHNGKMVLATGSLDSCANSLSVPEQSAIQAYSPK